MLMDEDGSEKDQVEVATLPVSQLFPSWWNKGLQRIPPLFLKRKEKKGGGTG
jgi:hypothetical protein